MIPKRMNIDDILSKYSSKIEGQVKTFNIKNTGYSREYIKFKEEMAPDLSRYEKWCKSLGSLIKLKLSEKDRERIQKELEVAHLDIEPSQSLTLSVMAFLSVFFLGLIISIAVVLIKGFSSFPYLFFVLMLILFLFLFYVSRDT